VPPLHELQLVFADSLRTGDPRVARYIADREFSAEELLQVYRNSWRSTLIEVLRMTYSAVDRLVGEEFFAYAADAFITVEPPRSGYLDAYGGGFADFLASFSTAAAYPYLADIARFEWALSCAANAEDMPTLDLRAFAGVQVETQPLLVFQPHPSVRLLELQYPADAIADAVLASDDEAMAAIDLASAAVRLVVNRGPNGVDAPRLTPAEYEFARRLFAGDRLAELIDLASADAAAFLADHFANDRLIGFHVAQGAGPRGSR